MRIAIFGGRHKVFLYGTRTDPAQQVQVAARFIIRTRSPGAAERLLTNHGAGRLIVIIEITGCIAQYTAGLHHGITVLAENGTCEPLWRGFLTQLQRSFKVLVLVYINAHHRAKDFLLHGFEMGIGHLDQGGLNEVAH